jgi:hypothetical protein
MRFCDVRAHGMLPGVGCASDAASAGAPTPTLLEITMRVEATIEVPACARGSGRPWRGTGCRSRCCRLAAAVAGGLGLAWPGPGVAGEGGIAFGTGDGQQHPGAERCADRA